MIPKLTDFSKEELRWIIEKVDADIHMYHYKIYQFDNEFPGGYIYQESVYTDSVEKLPIASQWLTKLTEALQEVERQERIQSN